jgi:hypothetical protein
LVPINVTSSNKLIYIRSGKPVTLENTEDTNANKLKVTQAPPVYDITSKTFTFSNEYDSEAVLMCEYSASSKAHRSTAWLGLAKRRKNDVEKLSQSLSTVQSNFNTYFSQMEQAQTSSSSSVKPQTVNLSINIDETKTELAKHAATQVTHNR